MTSLAVLRVSAEGRVIASSDAAKYLLGSSAGRACNRVVGGRDLQGKPICREGCVQDLLRNPESRTSVRQSLVQGQVSALQCEQVGGEIVVFVRPAEPQTDRAKSLTVRERQALSLVAEGLTRNEIADRLGIRPSTVRTHLEHARARFNAHTLAEAVASWLAEAPIAG